MKLTLAHIWLALICLVFFSFLATRLDFQYPYIWTVILILSGLKFLLVVFYFMEMKKANIFWKVLMTIFVISFVLYMLSY
jgi:hypothetical protein